MKLILFLISENVAENLLDLPAFEERFNMFMIVGVLILGLVLLLSLKIYQMESMEKEESKEKGEKSE